MGNFTSRYIKAVNFSNPQLAATFLGDLDTLLAQVGRDSNDLAGLEKRIMAAIAAAEKRAVSFAISQIVDNEDTNVVVVDSGLVTVATAGPFTVGSLVHYAGSTCVAATCNTVGLYATHIVSESSGSESTLAILTPETDILETGSGTDGTGNIYLFTGGGITRNRAQVQTTGGVAVGSAQIVQVVGTIDGLSSTSPASGFVRASFNPTDMMRLSA